MFPIFFSEISGMFPTVLTFPEKTASLVATQIILPIVGKTKVTTILSDNYVQSRLPHALRSAKIHTANGRHHK